MFTFISAGEILIQNCFHVPFFCDKNRFQVDEITSILVNEIEPRLERLEKEKSAYVEYTTLNLQLGRMERYVAALEWTQYTQKLKLKEEKAGTVGRHIHLWRSLVYRVY